MIEKLKKLSLIGIVFLFMMWCMIVPSFAIQNVVNQTSDSTSENTSEEMSDSYDTADSYRDYTIEKYDINMIVNEDNTFDITETITTNFNVQKHGIIRTIPLKNEIVRLNGSTSKNRVKISNIQVNAPYTTNTENDNLNIKIGNANETLTGTKEYKIQYTYNIGNDPIKNADELYYNLVGTKWDTTIKNVSFKITMPKDFDSSKLGFASGSYGSTENSNITYLINGRIITGKYNGILQPGEGLTIRCELPENYFVKQKLKFTMMNYILFLLSILSVVISIILWLKNGKEEQIPEVVEFYPPDGFNSLEVAYLDHDRVYGRDVTSLLLYLANKGYLRIITTSIGDDIYTQFEKLRDYDGNSIEERMFLDGLFPYGQTKVAEMDLEDSFYRVNDKISAYIHKRYKNKVYDKSLQHNTIFMSLLSCFLYFIITLIPSISYGTVSFMLSFFEMIGIWGFCMMCFKKNDTITVNGKVKHSKLRVIIMALFWLSMWTVIPFISFTLKSILFNTTYFINFIVGLICCVLIFLICSKFNTKTKYGSKMKHRIDGFKHFLITVEKEKLELMIQQDVNYYYNLLAYIYVLDISDIVAEKLDDLLIQNPSWYQCKERFTIHHMDHMMHSMSDTMFSRPVSSSSSGGSSSFGGGSSGGGSGGGGGSSW